MGYNSTFYGSLSPNKAIPEKLVREINELDLDVRVSDSQDDYPPGDIIPMFSCMHGYDIDKHIFMVVERLKKEGILLAGCIDRDGEDAGDHQRIQVTEGRVQLLTGVIEYKHDKDITREDVTSYGVGVFTSNPRKQIGWITRPLCAQHVEILYITKDGEGTPSPRHDYSVLRRDRRDALALLDETVKNPPSEKYTYEVVEIEDKI